MNEGEGALKRAGTGTPDDITIIGPKAINTGALMLVCCCIRQE